MQTGRALGGGARGRGRGPQGADHVPRTAGTRTVMTPRRARLLVRLSTVLGKWSEGRTVPRGWGGWGYTQGEFRVAALSKIGPGLSALRTAFRGLSQPRSRSESTETAAVNKAVCRTKLGEVDSAECSADLRESGRGFAVGGEGGERRGVVCGDEGERGGAHGGYKVDGRDSRLGLIQPQRFTCDCFS